MYMDTDSFICDIKTVDLYNDILFEIDQRFNISEYDKDNVFKLPLINKKKLGMMKDECSGNIIKEFIGFRAKMYSIQISNINNVETTEIKKIKGVKASVTSKLTIDDFRDCLYNKIKEVGTIYLYKSKLHQIFTQEYTNVTLNYLDDKRFVKENNIDTLALGHKDKAY